MKKLSQTILLASAVTGVFAGVNTAYAEVEVAASATVASMYLWRGLDLGDGAAAVSGDITVKAAGAYAGVWTSSGDTVNGNEVDLYVGYGAEVGDVSFDVSLWTYQYPSMKDGSGNNTGDNTFDYSEAVASIGFKGVSFSYFYPIGVESNDDYSYMTLGYEMDKVSALVGYSDDGAETYTHLNLGYAVTDKLAFTFSQVVAQSAEFGKDAGAVDQDLKVMVSYSLPIEM
jgi:uncharacterized protein (TIGR02001 family)